jgi:hypothetical protein
MQEQEDSAIQQVHRLLFQDLGRWSAGSWLDTSVFSPALRRWLAQLSNKGPAGQNLRRLFSQIVTVTIEEVTSVLVPDEIRTDFTEEDWSSLTRQFTRLLNRFDLRFDGFTYVNKLRAEGPSNVPQLKRDAVSAFGSIKRVQLRQYSKSYFEDEFGSMRVVCTLSSRYEDKGKRKYWYGFHETWNRWLEGSKDGYLLLGCMDTRICFALPLNFVRAQLPNLRSTGSGKDQYWHMDLVDVAGKTNLLDIPRLHQSISLSDFRFQF